VCKGGVVEDKNQEDSKGGWSVWCDGEGIVVPGRGGLMSSIYLPSPAWAAAQTTPGSDTPTRSTACCVSR
jgi:hypothetical protein